MIFSNKPAAARRGRRVYVVVLCCCLASARLAAESFHAGHGALSLETAIQQALNDNPGLAEVRARADAMASIPSQAGALPDPVVNIDTLNLPTEHFDLHSDIMSMVDVGISQTIPFPGKLTLKQEAAGFDAASAAQTAEEARLLLVRDVKQHWWQLFYLERTLEILSETEQTLRDLVTIAQTRYRVGEGQQQDVLQAQLELSRLAEEQLQHNAMHHGESARLAALLNRPAEIYAVPREESISLPDVELEQYSAADIELSRPLLKQKQQAIEAAQRRLELAKQDYYPDLTLNAGYAFRDKDPNGNRQSDFIRFGVSFNVPLYAGTKQANAIDQQQSEWMRERYAKQDVIRKIQADIASAFAEYNSAKEQHALLNQDIIPLTEQTIASIQTNYRVNRAQTTDLLRAIINRRNAQIQAWRIYAKAQQALAELGAAVGKEAL